MITSNRIRIDVVDALRGFAIMAIMLLHNIEHFDFYYRPENLPDFIKATDGIIWETLFFLFGGKAYSIFALLFGFTFYLMMDKQASRGKDFGSRFLWRLLLLLGFGFINSLFYEGDILTFYAVLGVSLVIVRKWSSKAVLITAVILMLQPLEWGKFFYILGNPDYVAHGKLSSIYFKQAFPYLSGDSFCELVKGNAWNGRLGVIFWSWENGRFFQATSLFMLGMLLGRKQLFIASEESNRFWKRTLLISTVLFIILYLFKENISVLEMRKPLARKLGLIVTSWSNFAFTLVLVSSFVLMFQKIFAHKILKKLQPFGRMSLTNYVMQSMLGSVIYYGFGLGLYKYTGATYSLFIGIILFLFQLYFCRWWLARHNQGPLEYLWHKGTWMKYRG